ncbi:MAG: GTP 3',8-cyclase MoaA [Planctomycetota bacterium]|nr:MAG: GTP 3',8-cyclase MoaA [Planctomycetota bacterium]
MEDKRGRPLRDLRISIIDSCNFRCNYCMPKDKISFAESNFLSKKQWLTVDEIVKVAKLFTNLGVQKIRITGGEPLLRPDLPEIIRELVKIPEIKDLSLTTNGYFLKEKAEELKDAGLHRITVSLDSLNVKTFEKITSQKKVLYKVLDGINEASAVGFSAIKINTVIQRGVNDQDIMPLIEYFKGTNIILRFIEFMDVGNINDWNVDSVVPTKEILNIIQENYLLEPVEPNYYGEVASRYRYQDGDGEVGFISSISQPFCRSCNRARITCGGLFYSCLFSSKGFALKPILNQPEQKILETLKNLWLKRDDRYSEFRNQSTNKVNKAEMYKIGG